MKTPHDLIFNGEFFDKQYSHLEDGECPYCFLTFDHTHKVGTKLKEFEMLQNKDKTDWENRFDEQFEHVISIFDKDQQEGVEYLFKDIKRFIREEFKFSIKLNEGNALTQDEVKDLMKGEFI